MSSSRAIQVDPLPISSGGAPTQTQKDMEKTNVTLSMISAQANADTKFDPPPPETLTAPAIQEAFSSTDPSDPSFWILAVAVAFILYGIVSK